MIKRISQPKAVERKRLKELKEKPVLTMQEIKEMLDLILELLNI